MFSRRHAAFYRVRSLIFKPMTIREAYIFLRILIHMGSEKMAKLKNYWRTPRGPLDRASCTRHYMSLRRFETLFTMFTVSPNSIELPKSPRNRHKPLKAWKRLTKEADAGARRQAAGLPVSQTLTNQPRRRSRFGIRWSP
jgi:hypothetical protein